MDAAMDGQAPGGNSLNHVAESRQALWFEVPKVKVYATDPERLDEAAALKALQSLL
jgi:hypothetical protein